MLVSELWGIEDQQNPGSKPKQGELRKRGMKDEDQLTTL